MAKLISRKRRFLLAGSSGTLALLSATATLAQASTGPATAAPTAEATSVQEVVVTAEKRSQNIQLVPGSVSAVSGARLESLGLQDLQDYAAYVPGLVINQAGSVGQTSVTLRGIAPVGAGSVVGYYIDDTPLGSSGNYARATTFALDLLPYDLDRFEVLRGPQGTLYGAGAMGGLIKYVLRQADTNQFSAQAGAELDDIDPSSRLGYAVRGAVNIPLVKDQLGIRVSGFDQVTPGYVDNVRLGLHDVNKQEQDGGRVALTWKPTDRIRVNLNALLYRQHSDDNNTVRLGNLTTFTDPGGALIYTGSPTLGDFAQSYAFRQPFSKSIDYYSGTVNWDLGSLTAVSATSWSHTKTHQVQDATETYGAYTKLFGMPAGVGKFDLNLKLDKFTQELRLVSPTGHFFEWLVGAFYTHERSSNAQLASVFDANYQPVTGKFASYFTPYFAFAQLPSTYEEYAVFGDVTLHFTDKFDVTGGLRYADNRQKFAQISDGLILGGYTNKPGSSKESVTTWSVNARYRFTRQVLLYAKVATGYRPGGPNVVLPGVAPTVNSDTLTSYEAGVKSTWLDGRLLLNVTGFDIDWTGIQLTVLNAARTASYAANAGDAFSRGVELEGVWSPIKKLRLGFNATYTRAELTKLLPGAPPYILGYELPGVPELSAGLSADYTWNLVPGWQGSAGAGLHYVDKEWVQGPYTTASGRLNTQNPSYTTLDLRLGVSNDRWAVNLFMRNATNRRVYLQGFPVQDAFTGTAFAIDTFPLQPRTFGVSVDAKF